MGYGAPERMEKHLERRRLAVAGRLHKLVARCHPGRALLALALVGVISLGLYVPARSLWGAYHYRAAGAALEKRQLAQARSHLEACLVVWPDDAAVHFLAARTARLAGFYEEAQRRLNLCQRLEEGPTDAIVLERALIEAQKGDFTDRLEKFLLKQVEQDHADAAWILEALAFGYSRTYCLQRAEKSFTQLLERVPDHVEAFRERGWVRERLGFNEQAVADYRRVLALDPAHPWARTRLPEQLLIAGLPSEAVEHFERLRQEQPDSLPVLLGLARGRAKLGEIAEARQILDGLAAAHPQDISVLVERGNLLNQMGQAAEAEPPLRRAVERDPQDYRANYTLAQCLYQCGKEAEAKKYQERAQRIAERKDRLGEYTYHLQQRPFDPDLRCAVARVFLEMGDPDQAMLWVQIGLRTDPNHEPSHQLLAECRQAKGQPAKAAEHRQKAGPAGLSPPADLTRKEDP